MAAPKNTTKIAATVTPVTSLSKADQAIVKRKLELEAKIRELHSENAQLNLELFKRGMVGPCW